MTAATCGVGRGFGETENISLHFRLKWSGRWRGVVRQRSRYVSRFKRLYTRLTMVDGHIRDSEKAVVTGETILQAVTF